MYRLNIGCEKHIIPNWDNLDNRSFPGAIQWSWNNSLPYPNDSVELILVQHSWMYVSHDNYDKNLQEIHRVLCTKGKFILKEEENTKYQWRKLGTKHRTGDIIGSTNLKEILPILEKNGFGNFITDPRIIVEKYGDIINRQKKLFKGWMFVVESEKI